MKKKLLPALIALCLLLCGASAVFADVDDINWADSYDDALSAAQETGASIFLLITAPSWCYWCQELEKNVFTNDDVVYAINDGYIPLRVLDTDADVNRFDFDGYPTVRVLDSYGNLIEDIYTQDAGEMAAYLGMYAYGSGEGGYGGYDDYPMVEWELVPDVAMYGGADWSGELYRESGLTLDEAKAIAEADDDVAFFFYMKGYQMMLQGQGTFYKGDAVFFAGEPWWGDAPQYADGYVKVYGNYEEEWGGE